MIILSDIRYSSLSCSLITWPRCHLGIKCWVLCSPKSLSMPPALWLLDGIDHCHSEEGKLLRSIDALWGLLNWCYRISEGQAHPLLERIPSLCFLPQETQIPKEPHRSLNKTWPEFQFSSTNIRFEISEMLLILYVPASLSQNGGQDLPGC